MNLDDFVLPGFPSNPEKQKPNVPNAIPIKTRKDPFAQQSMVPPGSAPINPELNPNAEFNYVQRHVRKTSIDDRKV